LGGELQIYKQSPEEKRDTDGNGTEKSLYDESEKLPVSNQMHSIKN
jgi:hypothetical protein